MVRAKSAPKKWFGAKKTQVITRISRSPSMPSLSQLRRMIHGPKTFEETFQASAITVGPSGVGGQFMVKLSDLPLNTSYRNIFDLFCIEEFTVSIVPQFNVAELNSVLDNPSSPWAGMGHIVYAVNKSPGVSAPTSKGEVMSEDDCKVRTLDKLMKIRVRSPKPLLPAYVGATGVYTEQKGKQWMSMGNGSYSGDGTGVNHYGVNYWVECPIASGATCNYNVYYKVRFSCKEQR